MAYPQQVTESQASPEVIINANGEAVRPASLFGKRQAATEGLQWGYFGGRLAGTLIADGAVTLTNSATNYLVAEASTGIVSVSTSTTNWDATTHCRLYKLTTAGGVVTAEEDHRVGPRGLWQLPQSAEPAVAAGTTSQYWRGDKSWRDFAADVRAAVLTGLNTALTGAVTASDTVLQALGRVQNRLAALANTDGLGEGSTNLWFTAARVRSTVLTGLSTASRAVITAASTVLDALGQLQAQVTFLETAGTNIASAATVDLSTATGTTVHITGTTTITAFTLANGGRRNLIFDGVLTLTHGTNLQLPGGANITTQAGDRAIVAADNAGVKYVVAYTRASGAPLLTGTDPDSVAVHRHLGAAAYTDMRVGPWGSATYDPPSISSGAQATTTVTVPGAVVGDVLLPPVLSISAGGLLVTAYVSAANTVTVVYANLSGGSVDLASHTVTIYVLRGI